MATDEAKLIVRFEAENKKLHQELDRTTKRLGRFEKSAKKNVAGISNAFKGLAIGVALGALTKKIVDETKSQEAAVRQLEQGLASTGNVVGRSLQELTRSAEDLQRASTFGDDEIVRAMSQLVTFTNITGTAFDRTTQAALDLSTRMDQDLKSSVLQLGKALNDPVANLGALGRAGIQFSDDQEEAIKSLAKTNRLAEAQDIILKELERQFGGSAKAARDTLGGALTSLNNAFGDLFEQKDGAEGLTSAVNDLTDLLQDPATVQGVQTLSNAIVNSFAAATNAIVGTVNVVKFLAEEFAAFVHGPALGDLPRLNEQLDDLLEKQAVLRRQANADGRDYREDPRYSALEQQIVKTRELIDLSKELARPARIKPANQVEGGGATTVLPTPDVASTVDPYKQSLSQVKNLLESLRSPQQEYADNVRILDSLLVANKLSQGEYNLALSEYKRILDESTGANAQWIADVASAEQHAELAKTEIQKLEEQLSELYALAEREPDLLSAETVVARADQIKAEIEGIKSKADETTKTMNTFADQAARNIQDSFSDFLFDPFSDGIDGMLKGFADTLRRMAAEAVAADLLHAIGLGGSGNAGGNAAALGGGASGLVQGEWDWMKKNGGGALSALGGFFGGFFADGGSPDPNKISVVGEKGPELFVPNGVRGEIVPNGQAGGGEQPPANIGVFIDPEAMVDFMATARGRQNTVENIRLDAETIRAILG